MSNTLHKSWLYIDRQCRSL